MSQIDDVLTEQQADVAALKAAVAANNDILVTIEGKLAAALASAAAAGISPAQLAGFQSIHNDLVAQTAAIKASDATAAPAPAPVPSPPPPPPPAAA